MSVISLGKSISKKAHDEKNVLCGCGKTNKSSNAEKGILICKKCGREIRLPKSYQQG